jgi:hypothetical protein
MRGFDAVPRGLAGNAAMQTAARLISTLDGTGYRLSTSKAIDFL